MLRQALPFAVLTALLTVLFGLYAQVSGFRSMTGGGATTRTILCSGSRPFPAALAKAGNVVAKRATEAYGVSASSSVSGPGCVSLTIRGKHLGDASDLSLGRYSRLVLADSGVNSSGGVGSPLAPGAHVTVIWKGRPNARAKVPVVLGVVPANDINPNSASLMLDATGNPVVNYTMDGAGSQAWCTFTTAHVNEFSPVVLDGRVVVDPVIQSAICGGQIQVTGLSLRQSRLLAADLNFGALPVQFTSVRTKLVSTSIPSGYGHKAGAALILGVILGILLAVFARRLEIILFPLLVVYVVWVAVAFILVPA